MRCIKLEVYSRIYKLLVDGLLETKEENCEQVLKTFRRDNMKINNAEDIKMVRVHRIPGGETRGPELKPRRIIAKFQFCQDHEHICNQRRKLQGQHFFLAEYFPDEI